jgi:hypothetical protein
MSVSLKNIFDETVKSINHIDSCLLNGQFFHTLCTKWDVSYTMGCLQKCTSAFVKVPFHVQGRPTNFNVTDLQRSQVCFQISYCNESLRNYHLSNFGITSENNIH